jgi:hypothetical protein
MSLKSIYPIVIAVKNAADAKLNPKVFVNPPVFCEQVVRMLKANKKQAQVALCILNGE